jgi:hypothetical protein
MTSETSGKVVTVGRKNSQSLMIRCFYTLEGKVGKLRSTYPRKRNALNDAMNRRNKERLTECEREQRSSGVGD